MVYLRSSHPVRTRKIFKVGINDADGPVVRYSELPRTSDGNRVQKVIWRCPFHSKWVSMLKRCYSENYKKKYPTYKDVTCCEEWLTFSNFKSWMETQDWEGKELDKDLLVYQNKVYSPETCVFVSKEINGYMVKGCSDKGEYPIGVSYHKQAKDMVNELSKPYHANISIGRKTNWLGSFYNPMDAHRAWQKAKIKYGNDILERQTDELIVEGINRVINKIRYDIENNLETQNF